MYPIMIDVKRFKVLIVGGGKIATRKVRGLVAEGAKPVIIAPEVTEELKELARQGQVSIELRNFRAGDTKDYQIVFICTNDPKVNQTVLAETTDSQLVNDTTQQQRSNFFNLATIAKKGFKIGITSQGKSPSQSKKLKQLIEKVLEDQEI